MISGSRVLVTTLAFLGGVLIAGSAFAQTRTISTTGTSTGSGSVHITIEDFNKPGWRDDTSPLAVSPQALVTIDVLIQEGWDCQQTTQAIFNALLAALPDGYVLTIFTRDPCTIVISCKKGATCDGWVFNEFVDTVPGQDIVPGEVQVPTQPVTWGTIKARYVEP